MEMRWMLSRLKYLASRGHMTEEDLERNLAHALGGKWAVDIMESANGRIDLIANRVGDEHGEKVLALRSWPTGEVLR